MKKVNANGTLRLTLDDFDKDSRGNIDMRFLNLKREAMMAYLTSREVRVCYNNANGVTAVLKSMNDPASCPRYEEQTDADKHFIVGP